MLLDTHALIWAASDSPRLSREAARIIDDAANLKLVSAVSAYEICAKHKLGKLPQAVALAADFEGEIMADDTALLAVTVAHAVMAGKLDMRHRDPFDRLLIAQALVERVPIVSNEVVFDGFGVERVW